MLPSQREERRVQLRSRALGADLIQESSRCRKKPRGYQPREHGDIKIGNDSVHELADLSLGFASDPSVTRMMVSVAELAFRCLQAEREARPSMDEVVKVLRVIQKEGERDAPEVVEVDDAALLKDCVPPLLSSTVTEKETSSSSRTTTSSSSRRRRSSF